MTMTRITTNDTTDDAPCEIVGAYAEITESSNHSMIGMSGIILYETRNMIAMSVPAARSAACATAPARQVSKAAGLILKIWNATTNGKKTGAPHTLAGSTILKRPQDRVDWRVAK